MIVVSALLVANMSYSDVIRTLLRLRTIYIAGMESAWHETPCVTFHNRLIPD